MKNERNTMSLSRRELEEKQIEKKKQRKGFELEAPISKNVQQTIVGHKDDSLKCDNDLKINP